MIVGHQAALMVKMQLYDLTKMASTVSRFVSASRKVGSYLINAVIIGQTASCGITMETKTTTKV